MRADIHDADGRKRIHVLNTARQVPLAGNCQHRLGPNIFHSLPRQRTARHHKKMKPQFLCQAHERADVAPAAALTICHRVTRNLMRATRKLEAMRRHDQKTIRRHFDMLLMDNLIAHSDKRPLDFPTVEAENLAQ